MRSILVLILFYLTLSMMSCAAPTSEGFAPSETPAEEPVAETPAANPPTTAADWEQQINISESTEFNGWTLVLNTNQSIHNQNLPNGWTIEAMHE